MYENYLTVNGIEVLNLARVAAYLTAFAPQLDVRCADAELGPALGHAAYVSPEADAAPWFKASRPATGRFYGLIPGKVQGVDDSTRQVPATELAGDGAIHTLARHSSRDIRIVATAVAADEEAMSEGIAWLRDILAGDGCGNDSTLGCTGREVMMLSAKPTTTAEKAAFERTFIRVETSEGPKVSAKLKSKSVVMWTIDIGMSAGVPWAFTTPTQVANLSLDSGVSFTDPAGIDCGVTSAAYDNFINDPYFTAIRKPPRPPAVKPPNLLDITSWRRKTAVIPASITGRWGRVVPVVTVSTAAEDAQYIRIRFYRSSTTLSECDYDGEFLISYLPANATMTLDGLRQEVTVTRADGSVVPGGHLLFGSDGRPFAWPSMGCQHDYTMVVDIMPSQPGVVALLDAAVRE
jgi:hypothetical protein